MEIMIDIETLGTSIGSVIIEAGLVAFDRGKVVSSHHCSLDQVESVKRGFTIDPITLSWWKGQGGLPEEILDEAKSVEVCLTEISRFILFHRNSGGSITRVWTRGNFDLPLLEAYFSEYLIPIPWRYYEHRELRTALDELGANVKPAHTEHRALADALAQTKELILARKNK